MAQLSTALGHFDDSVALAHTALYSVPRGTAPVVRSELLGLEARAYAYLGGRETANAVRSAEACVEVWQDQRDETTPDWVHYMGEAEVDCLAANAYIELALHDDDRSRARSHAGRAERYTLHARGARADGYTRSRIFDEIRIAKVRLAQREPAEAATVGVRALRLAEHTRSSLVDDWLAGLDRELSARFPDPAEVVDFRERLRDHLRRPVPQREEDFL